jgi:hypothetical protein
MECSFIKKISKWQKLTEKALIPLFSYLPLGTFKKNDYLIYFS